MALDGAAWATQANDFAAYVEGDTADELTPVGGGDAVPFVSQGVAIELLSEEHGGREGELLRICTRQRLVGAAQYTWAGDTWTVLEAGKDRAAGSAWPFSAALVRHAK